MLAMSTTEFPDPNKIYKNPLHQRNDSGELDVFEAAMYFSDATEVYSCRGGIISLQVPALRNASLSNSQTQVMEKPVMTKGETKSNYKQPNSPGGRIAHFLNSLFNQTGSKKKKKKSKSTTTQSMKDHEFDESSPGGRRRSRSSMSHFGSAPIEDPKPFSNSGFRTPPPFAITPTKAYKDLRSYSDHKPIYLQKIAEQYPCLDGKLNLPHAWPEKFKKSGKDGIWDGKCQTENKESRKFDAPVDDGGAESDSSSDLFELENYDLGFHSSSGLPVFETTHVDSIKRGATISNIGAI
ncbi:hypothetical protein RHMOL_Rhmol12G0080400 [Rhododendron molle]|uniref:Uncharacterized protein n=1 Tax=Rhododendron molle TaxID=49168 RepID=A0ACC0LH69_RHOML|nr:hypothetical protein RHMOL_Rhmol12G0080400 [Rhododendron molle]